MPWRQRTSNRIMIAVAIFTLWMGYYLQEARDQANRYRNHNTILQEAIDNMPSGMVLVDLAGNIQEWSPPAEAITGWKKAEVIGKPISYLMPEQYREAHEAYLFSDKVRESLKDVCLSLDCQILTHDKEYLPVHIRISTTRTDTESFLILMDRADRLKYIENTVSPAEISADPKRTRSFSDAEKS